MTRTIGYARVSSQDQCLDAQLEQLQAAGCSRVYSEKASGKSAKNREQLQAMLADLAPGDVVMVVRLDRVARSVPDLWHILEAIEQRGAKFKSINDAWCDTQNAMGRFITTIMGALAEFERTLILARTSAGATRARARGVKFGRKPKLDSRVVAMALTRVAAGETLKAVAKDVGVHWKTLAKKRAA